MAAWTWTAPWWTIWSPCASASVRRIRFYFSSWFLNRDAGLRTDLIQGHRTSLDIASTTITATIREEGGDEITSIATPVVKLDFETRRMTYQAQIYTIYGPMPVDETLQL